MSITTETHLVRSGLDRIGAIERVLHELEERKLVDLAATLRQVMPSEWETVPSVRITIAADLLDLDEKTVRTWAERGVLRVAETKPVVRLTAESVGEVAELLRDLREAGRTRGLLEVVAHRLMDTETLADPLLQQSLEEVERGEPHPAVVPEEYRHLVR